MSNKIIPTIISQRGLSLCEQLLSLNCQSVEDKDYMNARLSELNTLNYTFFPKPENDVMMLLINRLCSNIQPSDSKLIKNFSQLITNLIEYGTNISGRTFITCKKWILQVLEFSESEDQPKVLIAFKNIIDIGPFDAIHGDMQTLLTPTGLLRTLVLQHDSGSSEVKFLAINCIEAFVAKRERNDHTITKLCKTAIKEITYNLLSTWQCNDQDRLHYNRLVYSCLRILRYLVADKLINEDSNATSDILGIIQVYLFHGIKGYSTLKPKSLRPALMNIPERIVPPPRNRTLQLGSKTKAKKGKKEVVETVSSKTNNLDSKYTSDSDTSDSENMSLGRIETKIRFEAINLLQQIIHEIPCRDMFGYWSQIIVNTTSTRSRNLVWLIHKEPVSKLRQNALNTLTDTILGARTFLAYAEDSDHSTFRTFFGTVSAMLRELHSVMALILVTENNLTVLTHILKCITALIQTTPYARLKPGLVTKLAQVCRPHIVHKDPTTRVAALSIFEALATTDKLTSEIISILSTESHDSTLWNESMKNAEPDLNNSSQPLCYFIQICLQNISDTTTQVPVRLQSFKLLNAFINDDTGHLVEVHLESIIKHIVKTSQEPDPQIGLHSCRVIEKMSSRLAKKSEELTSSSSVFWDIIFKPITLLAQSEHVNLREVACDCLGTISSRIYVQLLRERQILIITTLFGAARDEESAVRAAGLRSLGMLITLSPLEENSGFVMDLADIVCATVNDENLGVRIKAAWALANLSDCLIRQMDNHDIEPLPLEILLPNLYKASIKAVQDNNKVKCNALRAVGNILYLYEHFQISSDTSVGLDMLISCATQGNDMKVRWNACRAIGLVISYKPDEILSPNWKDVIFPALCDLICLSQNFKVRTNAAWALTACDSYGKYIPFLWKNIVLALDNSQHVPNFIEYSHRDALIQQLCLALGHVAARTDVSDLSFLWPEIKDHVEDIAKHMKQFQERVLPEKTDDFVKAKSQFNYYAQIGSTSTERQIAKILANLLEPIDLYTQD